MERLSRPEDTRSAEKQTPLGRWGTVRDVADATVWLCGDAGGYVNGTVVVGEYWGIYYFFERFSLRCLLF